MLCRFISAYQPNIRNKSSEKSRSPFVPRSCLGVLLSRFQKLFPNRLALPRELQSRFPGTSAEPLHLTTPAQPSTGTKALTGPGVARGYETVPTPS